MPKDDKLSVGTARIDTKKKTLKIHINTEKISNTSEFIGTIMEEVSHGLDAVAGRQDEEVAKTTEEKGLESLGRPVNEYFQEQFEDTKSEISLKGDGKDYTNDVVGEKVGDVAVGISFNVSGSFIGRVNAGTSKYLIYNEENDNLEYVKTSDIGIGVGTLGIDASGSFIVLKNVDSIAQLESFVLGGGIKGIGVEFIYDSTHKNLVGFRISKSLVSKGFPVDTHGSIDSTIVRKTKNLKKQKLKIEKNLEKKMKELEKLVSNKKSISKNFLKISELSEKIKEDLGRMEVLWK